MKKNTEVKKNEMLSDFDIDGIWMSYRYCIPRHTIAAHGRAGDIAVAAYGRMTDERTQFMSEDINSCIYDSLSMGDWLEVDARYLMPKSQFRPLEILYDAIQKHDLKEGDLEDLRSICAYYDKDGNLTYDISERRNGSFSGKSMYDMFDLEVWQRLANLFDLKGHKWCKLVDGSVQEYYECFVHNYDENRRLTFKRYKVPVHARNLSVLTYIDEQFIIEDNIKM